MYRLEFISLRRDLCLKVRILLRITYESFSSVHFFFSKLLRFIAYIALV